MNRELWICILLFFTSQAFSQTHNRCVWIKTFNRQFVPDTLTIIPSSISFQHYKELKYTYNPNDGTMFITKPNELDSVEMCYERLPYALHKSFYNRDRSEISDINSDENSPKKNKPGTRINSREELFKTDEIQKSGSLSRGISFGNSQDVVVNSALNLQLEGKLTDDLNIRASITDQDVPFQPEGNTAQVQDLDRVLIELYNEKLNIQAGDIVLQQRPSHFLKYYKNVQGAMMDVHYKTGENSSAQTSFGASVAKGKFASVNLDIREGVSGPYRIEVEDASRLLIILANSERVFLDGKRLKRGYDFDYIIDYDRAEITFTANVIITKYTRIRVDVEYADQNYGRSIIQAGHYQNWGKFSAFFNYYSEKDNRNNPLKFDLTDDDKFLLSQIGDDLDLAIKDGYAPADYNPQRIQYEMIDTISADNVEVQIFKYSNDSEAALYDVVFSDVGAGNGQYVQLNTLANGIVFEWVDDVAGEKQGRFEPVRLIAAPNKKQILNGGFSIDITVKDRVYGEVAFSENDLNLFSDLDSDDNNGFAYKAGYTATDKRLIPNSNYKFSGGVDVEFTDKNFTPIDRFRRVEFDRDWSYNRQKENDQTDDNIISASLRAVKDGWNSFSYTFSNRKRENYIDGQMHTFEASQKLSFLKTDAMVFLMNNDFQQQRSTWKRLLWNTVGTNNHIQPGYTLHLDRNNVVQLSNDSTVSSGNNFLEHTFFIQSGDSLNARFRLHYQMREDKLPVEGRLENATDAQTAGLMFGSNHWKNNQLQVSANYRVLTNLIGEAAGKDEETLISRVDWTSKMAQGHIRSDLNFSLGSGRELRREFGFVEVQMGEGTHTWRDDNGNGIQELNEFYLAINADERQYIKIFVPTSEYVPAFLNNFNYRLNLDMPRNWRDVGGIKGFLSKFSNITAVNSVRKFTNPDIWTRFFPFGDNIKPEELLSSRLTANSRLFFNRSNPGFGFDVGLGLFDNKQLFAAGFESRRNEELTSNLRLNVKRKYNAQLRMKSSRIINDSDFLDGKDYHVSKVSMAPEMSWQPSSLFRITAQYVHKNNRSGESDIVESAIFNETNFIVRYNKAGNISFNGLVRFIDIDFTGQENSPLGYELLEALNPGRNMTWNIMLQKKLIAGLQISVSYEGRSSEVAETVHIGRMQVSALF